LIITGFNTRDNPSINGAQPRDTHTNTHNFVGCLGTTLEEAPQQQKKSLPHFNRHHNIREIEDMYRVNDQIDKDCPPTEANKPITSRPKPFGNKINEGFSG